MGEARQGSRVGASGGIFLSVDSLDLAMYMCARGKATLAPDF